MKRLSLICICVLQFFIFANPTVSATTSDDTRTVILNKKTEDAPKAKFPKLPAARPVSCVVTGNEIDVYCQYEATGDILVVDSRTGMTVASENAVELGYGYTLYIPEQYSEAPLTIYVTIAGTTYWGEI